MKMKKFALAGMMLPVFAMAVGCTNNGTRIGFSEAVEFAAANYDPCQYYGYDVSYNVKINRLAIKNVKLYDKISIGGTETIVLKNTLDFDFTDINIAMDPDVVPLIHVLSSYLGDVVTYTSTVNALLGYFDWGFVRNGNCLGVEVISTDNLATLINMALPIYRLVGKNIIQPAEPIADVAEKLFFDEPVAQKLEDLTLTTNKHAISAPTLYTSANLSAPGGVGLLKYITAIQVDTADMYADAHANNVGLLSNASLNVNLDNLLVATNERALRQAPRKIREILNFSYATVDSVTLDLSFVADYK